MFLSVLFGSAAVAAPPPLLPLVAEGETGAVEACLERYGGLVLSLVRRQCRSEAEGEEIVQEVFLDLWRHAARFDPARGGEATFVALLTRRRLIDRLRKNGRRVSTESLPDDESAETVLDSGIERGAEVALARRALGQLPREHRRVLVLSLLHGLSHGEIAEHTRLPLGTVKSWVRRGLETVRKKLGQGRTVPEVAP
ncbi:MAG: sigma-70 family RNA polymerase sigma factor [Thermoanaerobaculia bacterium]|nr:sigma-70 family RNA polymerase sigma factor [Thermoanaerobaculia bacterium]